MTSIPNFQSPSVTSQPTSENAIAIIGIGCRYPGGVNNPADFWALLRDGVDAIAEIPSSRWSADLVYDPDPTVHDKINTRWGGFLEQIDQFDPLFFGIAPREAVTMDPQQRLLLETTWEALEDADQVPQQLRGSKTGVFVGIGTHDYSVMLWQQPVDNPYTTTGTGNCVAANRISYYFDFKGPSLAIDTACSSSLVAVHLACESIRRGESEMAIAAGVNIMLVPTVTAGFSNGGFMSGCGRCQSFDAHADGYVRSEGVGAVLLKPLEQAIADGDPIYAVIRGSAVNQDGGGSAMVVPNPHAQVEVLQTAYRQAGVDPAQVRYVEAHGTGTKVGDPIEAEALGAVMAKGRSPDHPCLIGSVKTNIGHTETAAGVTGIIKAALMLKYRQIPPSLHFSQPNPAINFAALKLEVNTTLTSLESAGATDLQSLEASGDRNIEDRNIGNRNIGDHNSIHIGVNSFGFGGTNAHVVVSDLALKLRHGTDERGTDSDRAANHTANHAANRASSFHALTLSAKNNAALQTLAQQYIELLTSVSHEELAVLCGLANRGRSHFSHRLACVADSSTTLRNHLEAWIASPQNISLSPGITSGIATDSAPANIIFLFTGQGSQSIGMGQELYSSEPVFRDAMDECDRLFQDLSGESLLTLLYPGGEWEGARVGGWKSRDAMHSPHREIQESGVKIHQTCYTQPALFAFEYALAQLWISWGVEPGAVLGHSIGEYVAACVAGVFSLEDGLRLITARGQLMQSLPGEGMMVSVRSSAMEMAALIDQLPEALRGAIAIAAINEPQSTVIAGADEAIAQILTQIDDQGMSYKPLQVSHAFHSPLMEPMLDQFRQVAMSVTYHEPMLPLVSTVTGKVEREAIATAEYWVRHVRQPVQFLAAMQTLYGQRMGQAAPQIFLEIGAKPILLGMGRHCLPDPSLRWLPSLRPEQSDRTVMLNSVAELYVSGVVLNWTAVEPVWCPQRLSLPTYPFQRQRYWCDDAKVPSLDSNASFDVRLDSDGVTAASATPSLADHGIHPLLGDRIPLAATTELRFQSCISFQSPAYLSDHRILAQVVLPGAAYVEMAIAAGLHWTQTDSITLTNVVIEQPLRFPESGTASDTKTLQLVLSPDDDSEQATVQIFSLAPENATKFTRHVQGAIAPAPVLVPTDLQTLQLALLPHPVVVADYYQTLADQGLTYGSAFQAIRQLWHHQGQALSQITIQAGSESIESGDRYHLHPILLDACFQTIGAAVSATFEDGTYLPVGLDQLDFYQPLQRSGWCGVMVRLAEPDAEPDAEFDGGVNSNQRTVPKILKADLTIWDDQGAIATQITGMKLQFVRHRILPQLLGLKPQAAEQVDSSQDIQDVFYDLVWHAQPQTESKVTALPSIWIVFADGQGIAEQVTTVLAEKGDRIISIQSGSTYRSVNAHNYQIDVTNANHFLQLFNDVTPTIITEQGDLSCQILYLWSSNTTDYQNIDHQNIDQIDLQAQQVGCGGLLHLVQTIAQCPALDARLWIGTQATQAVDTPTPLCLAQSTLWGLARTVRMEQPGLRCVSLDLPPTMTSDTLDLLVQDLRQPDQDDQIAYRGGDRFVARLLPHSSPDGPQRLPIPATESFRLGLSSYGVLDHLTLMPVERCQPGADEVEIQVKASGLNFRDVLNALGMLQSTLEQMGITSPTEVPFGGECAGIVTNVGANVSHLHVGDPVIAAQAVGSLRQFITVPAHFVVPQPQRFTFAEAATVPTTFLTAYYGIIHLANLQSGETVLIHAAAGGVGQAAVQIAQHIGATVLATASPGKWSFLQGMGIDHVMNSRTLDFADEVLACTEGRGVDVVFNSLNGDVIPKNLEVLATNGRFVEIGKIGIWSPAQVQQQRADVTYYPFDLLEISQTEPLLMTNMLEKLLDWFNADMLKPLPKTVFSIDRAPDAFRYMAQARHIGKVVLTLPAIAPTQAPIQPDASYLVTGGLGALGLHLAQTLVAQGARHLILLGRQSPTAAAHATIKALEKEGVMVKIIESDVTNYEALTTAIASYLTNSAVQPPLKGVFHLAGTLDDGLLINQTWQQFASVLAPKLLGAWNLHCLTRTLPLDHFVCFSSIASLIGSPGQGNYAAANAFLDALAHHRHSLGLTALSLNWGPWEAGMAATLDASRQQRLINQGFYPITPTQGAAFFVNSLTQPQAQLGILPLNWPQFLDTAQTGDRPSPPPFLSAIQLPSPQSDGIVSLDISWLQQFLAQPERDRPAVLATHLQTQLAKVMGFPDPTLINPTTQFGDLGMDSLMAVEFSNRLQTSLGCPISPSLTFDYPNITSLAAYLATHLAPEFTEAGEGRKKKEEGRRKKEEGRRKESEVSSQESEGGRGKSEAGSQESGVGRGKGQVKIASTGSLHVSGMPEAIQHSKSNTQNLKPTTPNAKGDAMQTPHHPTPPPATFTNFPAYRQLRQDLDRVNRMGNPFFTVHDGIARDTTQIGGRSLINYSSYNYLGLSGDPRVTAAAQDAIATYGTSVSASRVVSGERLVHCQLEQGIAEFLGTEDCIVYIGGHATNVTTIGHLFQDNDLVVCDALSHNSIREGCRLSSATVMEFPHNDWQGLDRLLSEHRHRYENVLVAIEGVYSTDGDVAPLPDIVRVKTQHGAFLLVDEAHSIGVLGTYGGGIGDHFGVAAADVDLWMGTLSKSFASCGGYIAGCAELVEYLKYTAPGFVFSVGMSPANAAAALAALEIIKTEPERIAILQERSRLFLALAQSAGLNTGTSGDSPVVPVIVGAPQKAVQLSQTLFHQGINVQPMVYPSVPHNGARLRFFLNCLHSEDQIRQTVQVVSDELIILNTLTS